MADVDLTFLELPDGVTPDWPAAERAVASLTDAELMEVAENVGLGQNGQDPTAQYVRQILQEDLPAVRTALEQGYRGMQPLSPTGMMIWVADQSMSHELYWRFERLKWSGVLVPAGFTDLR